MSEVVDVSSKHVGSASVATVTVGRFDENDLRTQWTAALALGAYGELTRGDQEVFSDLFSQASVSGPDSKGAVGSTGLGVGAVSLGQRFASPSDGDLRSRVDEGAGRFGLAVTDVEVLHPLESALQVRLVVPDEDVSWTLDQLCDALEGSTPDVEGSFLELTSRSGAALVTVSTAYRTGEGAVWNAPGQGERFGLVTGRLDVR